MNGDVDVFERDKIEIFEVVVDYLDVFMKIMEQKKDFVVFYVVEIVVNMLINNEVLQIFQCYDVMVIYKFCIYKYLFVFLIDFLLICQYVCVSIKFCF